MKSSCTPKRLCKSKRLLYIRSDVSIQLQKLFLWPTQAPCSNYSIYITLGTGCISQTPLVRPSPAALLFLSSYVTNANELEIKRLPGKEHKTGFNGSHCRSLQPLLSVRGRNGLPGKGVRVKQVSALPWDLCASNKLQLRDFLRQR